MTLTAFARATTIALLFVPLAAAPAAWAQPEIPDVDLVGIEQDTGNLYRITIPNAPLGVTLSLIKEDIVPGGASLGSLDFVDGSLWGITTGFAPQLCEFNLEGEFVRSVPLAIGYAQEGGLAVTPDGTAYGISATGSSALPRLFSFDWSDPTAVATRDLNTDPTGGNMDVNGLAWLPGSIHGPLLGLDRFSDSIVRIDPDNGDTARVSDLQRAEVGGVGGMAVTPDGRAFFNTSGPGGYNPGGNALHLYDPINEEVTHSWAFPTNSGSTLNGAYTIDGVGISGLAVVPEPATLSLLLLGGLVLLRRRRA